MEMFIDLVSLAVKAMFVENMLLAFFLGMCSFLACSKKIETATGLGAAVVFVLTICTPANWAINTYLLKKGAWAWAGQPDLDLSFLQFISFIAVIATMVQLVEMTLDKFSPALYAALGVFLPLITVNCSILGASLFMDQRKYDLVESTVFGFGSGVGFLLAIVALASIRGKLTYAHPPKIFEGYGMVFIITGLMAMAFMCFAGIQL